MGRAAENVSGVLGLGGSRAQETDPAARSVQPFGGKGVSSEERRAAKDRRIQRCPSCGQWFTLRDILESPLVQPIGVLFGDDGVGQHRYYFNHVREGCGTTFTIPVTAFIALIEEPIPAEAFTGTERCERHCAHIDDLSVCSQDCHYAPFRRFLLSMREMR
jgi:hypothetical protein